MDNNNLSNIPVSELAKRLDESKKSEANPSDKTQKPQKSLFLILAGIVLLAGVGVALYFIFRKPAEAPSETTEEETPASEVVWSPPEGSLDPNNDYLIYQQGIIDDDESSFEEKLDSELSIANLYSVTGMYTDSENLLNGIDRSRLTSRQLFQVYSAYAYLYEHSGDEAKYNEYSALVEEVLNQYWGEQESAEGE